jgi:hypothetical protein
MQIIGTDLATFVKIIDTTLDARTFATPADREPERAVRPLPLRRTRRGEQR